MTRSEMYMQLPNGTPVAYPEDTSYEGIVAEAKVAAADWDDEVAVCRQNVGVLAIVHPDGSVKEES